MVNQKKDDISLIKSIFDLKKYAGIEQFDIEDWHNALHTRNMLLGDLPKETDEKINTFFDRIVSNPLNTFEWQFGYHTRPPEPSDRLIRDVSILDLTGVNDVIRTKIEGIDNALKSWDETYDLTEESSHLMKSYHSTLMEQKVFSGEYGHVMIDVTLGGTDQDLIDEFTRWLKNKNKEVKEHDKIDVRKNKYTKREFEKWIKNRVLQYLDLIIISNFYGIQLTNHMTGSLIFPEIYDVDTSEKIRKTVKPLAEKLTENNNIDSMMYAAYTCGLNKAE